MIFELFKKNDVIKLVERMKFPNFKIVHIHVSLRKSQFFEDAQRWGRGVTKVIEI